MKKNLRQLQIFCQRWLKTDIRYLAVGGFWLVSAKVAAVVVAIVSSVALANLLTEEAYGTFRFVLAAFALLSIPTLKGLDTSLITNIARAQYQNYRSAILLKLKYGLITSALSLVVGGYYYHQGNGDLALVFIISALLLPLMEVGYLYVAYLNGEKDFFSLAKYITISRIFSVTCLVVCALIYPSVIAITVTYLLSHSLVRLLFMGLTLLKANAKRLTSSVNSEDKQLGFGKHLSVIEAVNIVGTNIDKLLLFHFIGPATLAGYYLALMPFRQMKNILASLNALALPKFSAQKLGEIKKTLPRKLFLSYLLIIPAIGTYLVLADPIFDLLFPKYIEFANLSKVFVLLLLLYPTSLIGTVLTSHHKSRELYQNTLVSGGLRIIALCVTVPLWGLKGAVFTILISQLLFSGLLIYQFIKLQDTMQP